MRIQGRYFIVNHQRKGETYLRSLSRVGYYPTHKKKEALFLLTDRDVTKPARDMIHEIRKREKGSVFLYPHSASPSTVRWDGMYTPHPDITCVFVHAPGHKKIMECYGFPHRIEVAGWSYSEIKPFKPSKEIRRVLFAPIHPNHNGWLSEEDQTINQRTFQILHELSLKHDFKLKVRYLHFLKMNGLERVEGVEYIRGIPDLSHKEIDEADIVISHETFAYLSVALGKPTLMMAEDIAPRLGHSEQLYKHAEHWDDYKHLMMYPLDILTSNNPYQMMLNAIESEKEIVDWKERMIGQPFDRDFVNRTILSYL